MTAKDLLVMIRDSVLRPTETATLGRVFARVDEVLAAIEALQVADKITPAQALVRVDWRAALFPFELFALLLQAAPKAQRADIQAIEKDLRGCLQDICHSAKHGDADKVLAERDRLVRLRAQLETLSHRLQDGSWSTRLLRNAVILSGLCGALATLYLRSDLGMQLVRIEGLVPAAAYQALGQAGGDLVAQPDYLDDFMREFSKSYFGHQSQFDSIYYDKPKDGKPTQRRTLQHKISLRNASHGLVRYVSSVEAVVDVRGDARFPWERLTVTPRVSGQPTTPLPTMKSDGIGPALDFAWTWQTQGGLVLGKGQQAVFHREEQQAFPSSDIGERAVQTDTLAVPLWLKLEQAPSAPDANRYLQVGPSTSRAGLPADCLPPGPDQYGWYEILKTPSQLRGATAIGYDEAWTLELRHRALNQAHETVQRVSGRLGKDRVYFRRAARLFERDPRCGGDHDSDGIMDSVDGPPLEQLAAVFADEKALAQPKGVDLLTARLGVDLWKIPTGRRIAASAELDGFLNPQGILAVYLTLNMPDRLNYHVSVRVNGQTVATYGFAGLVPEFLSFHDEGEDKAIQRLRQVFGVQRP